MTLDFVRFYEIIKGFFSEPINDVRLFNMLFDWMEDEYMIERKGAEYEWDKAAVSLTLNRNRKIPRDFLKTSTRSDFVEKGMKNVTEELEQVLMDNKTEWIKTINAAVIMDSSYSAELKIMLVNTMFSENIIKSFFAVFKVVLEMEMRRPKSNSNGLEIYSFSNNQIINEFISSKAQLDLDEIIKKHISSCVEIINTVNETEIVPNNFLFSTGQKVNINNDDKSSISCFAKAHNCMIGVDFYNFGNLRGISLPGGTTLQGNESEKSKYSSVCELIRKIHYIAEARGLLKPILESYYWIPVIWNNMSFKETNIEVQFLFPKNCILRKTEYSFSSNMCAEQFMELYEDFWKLSETRDVIMEYENEAVLEYSPLSDLYGDETLDEADATMELLFPYKIIEDDKYDVIKFHFDSLMHNTAAFFPVGIFLKHKPECIEYEIKSDNSGKVIKGVLK